MQLVLVFLNTTFEIYNQGIRKYFFPDVINAIILNFY